MDVKGGVNIEWGGGDWLNRDRVGEERFESGGLREEVYGCIWRGGGDRLKYIPGERLRLRLNV